VALHYVKKIDGTSLAAPKVALEGFVSEEQHRRSAF